MNSPANQNHSDPSRRQFGITLGAIGLGCLSFGSSCRDATGDDKQIHSSTLSIEGQVSLEVTGSVEERLEQSLRINGHPLSGKKYISSQEWMDYVIAVRDTAGLGKGKLQMNQFELSNELARVFELQSVQGLASIWKYEKGEEPDILVRQDVKAFEEFSALLLKEFSERYGNGPVSDKEFWKEVDEFVDANATQFLPEGLKHSKLTPFRFKGASIFYDHIEIVVEDAADLESVLRDIEIPVRNK